MVKKTKLIKDVDDEIWQMFAGYSKAKGKKVSDMLNEVLKEFLKGKIR